MTLEEMEEAIKEREIERLRRELDEYAQRHER